MPFKLQSAAMDFRPVDTDCPAPGSTASLHAHLLRLPSDERQKVIAGLSSPCRAELSNYIQAMQKGIDEGYEPELEPPARSPTETAPPSSESPSSQGTNIKDLFARARLVRETLEAKQDSPWCRDDAMFRHEAAPRSSSSSSNSDLDSDIELSEDSDAFGPPADFAVRVLLRHLSEATPEMRRIMIRSLTRERRVDLFAYMISSRGRAELPNAFGEEELFDPDIDDLEDQDSFAEHSDDEFSMNSDTRYFLQTETDILGCDEDTKTNSEHENTSSCLGSLPDPPLTPSTQQLVFRPRNAMPLGALQRKQLSSKMSARPKCAGKPVGMDGPKKELDSTGVDASIVLDWLCGHISGPLCLARLLEGMQWARFSYKKDAKTLCSTQDLYSASIANGYGGTLGCMVGGVAQALASDVETQLGGLFNSLDGPERGLKEADAWIRKCVEDPTDYGDAKHTLHHLEGLASEDINLTFRRRCVALHPHRNAGQIEDYLKAHVYIEILRQWQEVSENPMLLHEQKLSNGSFQFNDAELFRELQKDSSSLVEESKCADPDELLLKAHEISSHVLQLSWIKEKLEAEVNFMRNQGAYVALGIGPEASDAELARAYKAQALRLHPDRGGSTEAFQALQSAYERILKQREGKPKKNEKTDASCEHDANDPSADETKVASRSDKFSECEKQEECNAEDVVHSHEQDEHEAKVSPPVDDDERKVAPGDDKSTDCEALPDDEVKNITSANYEAMIPPDSEETTIPVAACNKNNKTEQLGSAHTSETDSVGDSSTCRADMHQGRSHGSENGSIKTEKENLKPSDSYLDDTNDIDACLIGSGEENVSSFEAHIEDLEKSSEDLEKQLVSATKAIPAEAVAGQAEIALQSAQMCLRAMRLCARAAEVGPDAWPQLQRLTSHALEASQHVAEACNRISDYAGLVPTTVMPLLNTVSQHSSRLEDAMVRQVIKGTQSLLSVTEHVSSLSKEVTLRESVLVKHAAALVEAMQGFIGHDVMLSSVCESIADVLETVARLGREAAEVAGSVSMAVNEAQRHAENLVEVLGAAGLWQKMDATQKTEQSHGEGQKGCDKKQNPNDKEDSDASDTEKEPWEQYVERANLMQKLNGEVVSLQQELRALVNQDPALIPAVSASQKEHLFAVVAELLSQAHKTVSRVWYEHWSLACPSAMQDFVMLMEKSLGFIFTASSWQQVAVPSIEARLLRLAALLDSQLLCTMLQEEVFQHALELAPKENEQALQARFTEVTQAMRVGFAGG